MQTLELKPTHKPVQSYYAALRQFEELGVRHETAVRSAFQNLLAHCARQHDWTLVPEWEIRRQRKLPLRVDGALVDGFRLTHGYWEAKDIRDDLQREVRRKFEVGYPRDNIIFQTPHRALLYQNDTLAIDADLTKPQALIDTLSMLFSYTAPAYDQWERAVAEFQERVPELARSLVEIIERERKTNQRFIHAFADFTDLTRRSINPNLADAAVEEMLIQHLLTERLFRTIFNNSDFSRRNIIACEIEKVIDALTSQSFSRADFLRKLDRFYVAIEQAAATISDFSQKQQFLNTVYEKFFQGFCVKVADTHGIVYTPPSIVRFMVKSVAEILEKEFGKTLGSKGVHILDPFVGTGNFIVHLMREIPRSALPHKFAHELHANEIMLLPYYIASMNIEHEYYEATGKYEAFEGMCLVDTFETAEGKQFKLFTEANTQRVKRQKESPIFVVIGNPPYNAWQADENDRNKNRKYPVIDKRVADTYGADSTATLQNSLRDPYIKALRWASDRIGDEGVVAFVTNSGFLDGIAADGMRKNLVDDFDVLYILDLGGNVRKNPKLSGTTHNVFGIQVGVSINFLVRKRVDKGKKTSKPLISYASTQTDWRKEQKWRFLDEKESLVGVSWRHLEPDDKHTWLTEGLRAEFDAFVPLGSKAAKASRNPESIFGTFSNGVKSNSDAYVYDFNRDELTARAKRMVEAYSAELDRWRRAGTPKNVEDFLRVNERELKWIRRTKKELARGKEVAFDPGKIREAQYRPFARLAYYFGDAFNEDTYQILSFFPDLNAEEENRVIWLKVGMEVPMFALATNRIPDLLSQGGSQCFPFYTYAEDGSERRENITDWTLREVQSRYGDKKISRWDIFYFVYAVLHHPHYRERYAANLRRELPRIPYAPDFRGFATAGKQLAELHVKYEQQEEYWWHRIENPKVPLSYRVEKMKLTKDKRSIIYNEFLTIDGIPPEVFEYRLGNRSALEWVIDQYQVSTDKRSGITNDPNRLDDPEYIIRLIGQVITVSLETVKIVRGLPPLEARQNGKGA
ncbi:MAG: N-6 DNA methylase [Acidobacteriia bacterium]|nr:N-6 DNA methylase [Terriglobia bacterium]